MATANWTDWKPLGNEVQNAEWRNNGAGGRIQIRVNRGTIDITMSEYTHLVADDPKRPGETINARFHRRVQALLETHAIP